MCSGSEAGSYLRRIGSCITQLKTQEPSRTCHKSKEEEEASSHSVPMMYSKRHLPDIEQWSRAVAATSSRGGLFQWLQRHPAEGSSHARPSHRAPPGPPPHHFYLQGYLAHRKPHPPRTLKKEDAQGIIRMSEVPLHVPVKLGPSENTFTRQ